jgi:hypothetical protein
MMAKLIFSLGCLNSATADKDAIWFAMMSLAKKKTKYKIRIDLVRQTQLITVKWKAIKNQMYLLKRKL